MRLRVAAKVVALETRPRRRVPGEVRLPARGTLDPPNQEVLDRLDPWAQ